MDNYNQLKPEPLAPMSECCAKNQAQAEIIRRLEDDDIAKLRDVFDDMFRVRKDIIKLEIKIETETDLNLLKIWKTQKVAVDQLYNYKADEIKYLLEKSKK